MTDLVQHITNTARQPHPIAGPDAETRALWAAIRRDPDYAPSPMIARPTDAAVLGLGGLWVKNEGARLADRDLGSFKPVGVMGALWWLTKLPGPLPDRLVCASDGNFGRAVAWAAARHRIAATIFVPSTVSAARIDAIRAFGAGVVVVSGGYDRAMSAAREAAQAPGVLEFTDTGHAGMTQVPDVIQRSYGLIAEESVQALGTQPTHVFVPAGVGGLVAGVLAGFDMLSKASAPRVIAVQPHIAATIPASLAARAPQSLPEIQGDAADPPTVMVGLACETMSTTAWPVLSARLADALAIPDAAAVAGLRRLAQAPQAERITAGESGAAAYGALLAVCDQPRLRQALGLDDRSRVLVLVTETATDRDLYHRLLQDA